MATNATTFATAGSVLINLDLLDAGSLSTLAAYTRAALVNTHQPAPDSLEGAWLLIRRELAVRPRGERLAMAERLTHHHSGRFVMGRLDGADTFYPIGYPTTPRTGRLVLALAPADDITYWETVQDLDRSYGWDGTVFGASLQVN